MPAPFTGRIVFTPPLWATAATILLCVLFVSLGRWQWNKGNLREAEWEHFKQGADRVMPLAGQGLADVPLFQRVRLAGRFEPAHQFLLDNLTHGDEAGYEVLTPLQRPDGRVVLVNRGWVPFTGWRARLPPVAFTSHGMVTITGRTGNLPVAGLAFGRAPPPLGDHWPKVTTYPTFGQLAAALGHPVEPRVLLLDPKEPNGYLREWKPAGTQRLRNWSYAVQWWGFALMAVILWVIMNLRRVSTAP